MNKPLPDGPMPAYRARVSAGALDPDPAQRHAAEKLQILHRRLKDYNPARPTRVGLGLFGWGRDRLEERVVPGLYIHGGVGQGKSMLMDLFFETAPVAPKRRVHFHAFMQEIHAAIHAQRARGGEDPVRPVADAVADGATLLCFDEMQVSDITDAMLVGRLFEQLFARGVVVVATSNRAPEDLYKDGLNRHLFLPFIALIKDRLEVHHLAGVTDHRMDRAAAGETVYFAPLDAEAEAGLEAAWDRHAGEQGAPRSFRVKGRDVTLPRVAGRVAWAGFADLCDRPLGPGDYLALAEALDLLILEGIPVLTPAKANEAKRFVTLIDALYEARVALVCSAAAEPADLYPHGTGAFEFARTASRLHEMRATGWGARSGSS